MRPNSLTQLYSVQKRRILFFPFLRASILLLLLCYNTLQVSAQGWDWARSGTGVHCDAWGVATDRWGNIYGAGNGYPLGENVLSFGSINDTLPLSSSCAVWIKYSPAGVPLWSGFTTGSYGYLNNICTDAEGNLLVYGSMGGYLQIDTFSATGTGMGSHYFIAKISPAGTVLWLKSDGCNSEWYGYMNVPDTPAVISEGGITTDTAGNIYISGTFHDSTIIGHHTYYAAGGHDAFVAKYSPSGALVWASTTGGTGNDIGLGIAASSSGNIYICGYTTSPSFTVGTSTLSNSYSKSQAFIAKFSPAGVPLWGQVPGGPNGSFATGLQADDHDNVYMTGGFGDTSISFGTTTLTRSYPQHTPQLALYLVQYSSSGIATWGKTICSRQSGVWGFSISISGCEQVWVSGNYTDTISIDGALMPPFASGTYVYDPVFLAGYNLTGGVVGYSGLTTGGDDQNGIACDVSGNVFLCSDIEEGALYAGPDTLVNVLPHGILGENIYITKYHNTVAPPDSVYRRCDTSICSSGTDSITITAPAGYAYYFWNDGTTSPSRNFHTAGTYRVVCFTCGVPVLVDSFVLSDTLTTDTVTNRYDTSICRFSDEVIPVTLTAPSGGSGYKWTTGDTTIAITITDAGSYWVSYRENCALYIDTFVVHNMPKPAPIAGPDTLCTDNTTALTDAITGGIWTSRNTAIATIDSMLGWATGIAAGEDSIFYRLTDGCFAERSEMVLPPPCVNAVHDPVPAENKMSLYPLPATNELNIITQKVFYTSLTIVNVVGQEMMTQPIYSLQTKVATDNLPPGFYYLILSDPGNSENRAIRKFVKE